MLATPVQYYIRKIRARYNLPTRTLLHNSSQHFRFWVFKLRLCVQLLLSIWSPDWNLRNRVIHYKYNFFLWVSIINKSYILILISGLPPVEVNCCVYYCRSTIQKMCVRVCVCIYKLIFSTSLAIETIEWWNNYFRNNYCWKATITLTCWFLLKCIARVV